MESVNRISPNQEKQNRYFKEIQENWKARLFVLGFTYKQFCEVTGENQGSFEHIVTAESTLTSTMDRIERNISKLEGYREQFGD